MEYWKAWVILITIVIIAAAVGFGIAYYVMTDKDASTSDSTMLQSEEQEKTAETPLKPEEDISQKTQEAQDSVQQTQETKTQSSLGENPLKDALQKLLERYDQDTKSFIYRYDRNKYYVRGNNIKIEYFNLQSLGSNNWYDTVYLNTVQKESIAFCTGRDQSSKTRCQDKEHIALAVPYNNAYTKNPQDWVSVLRGVTPSSFKENVQMIFGRNVDEIKWFEFGEEYVVYADHKYGIPVKIITPQEEYDYKEMGINQVSERDVSLSAS